MSEIERLSSDIDESVSIGNSMVVNIPEQCKSLLPNTKNVLKLFTLNIRSINRNFDDLQVLLSRLNIDYEVIILTECWLSKNSILPKLQNYKPIATNQNFNQNDGIVIYLKENIPFITLELRNL